jgi:hypothetical protein
LCHSSFESERDCEGSVGEGSETVGAEESEVAVMRRVEGASEGGRERGEAVEQEKASVKQFAE